MCVCACEGVCTVSVHVITGQLPCKTPFITHVKESVGLINDQELDGCQGEALGGVEVVDEASRSAHQDVDAPPQTCLLRLLLLPPNEVPRHNPHTGLGGREGEKRERMSEGKKDGR